MKNRMDDLDREIVLELQKDARRSFRRIAKRLKIAEATVRNRVKRMTSNGILKLEARVNPTVVPGKIAALVGLNLEKRSQVDKMREIEKIPSVTSVWNATGRFDLFFEVMVDSLQELNEILFEKDLNDIGGISHSETFVMLSSQTKFLKLS